MSCPLIPFLVSHKTHYFQHKFRSGRLRLPSKQCVRNAELYVHSLSHLSHAEHLLSAPADASSIAVSFSAFTPSVTSADPTNSRQNCQAVVSVAVPAGQQFTIDKVEYVGLYLLFGVTSMAEISQAGFVQLQQNVSVSHSTSYYCTSIVPHFTHKQLIESVIKSKLSCPKTLPPRPNRGLWVCFPSLIRQLVTVLLTLKLAVRETDFTNSFTQATPIWSACGADSVININIAVLLDNTVSSAAGFAAVDSAKVLHPYSLEVLCLHLSVLRLDLSCPGAAESGHYDAKFAMIYICLFSFEFNPGDAKGYFYERASKVKNLEWRLSCIFSATFLLT